MLEQTVDVPLVGDMFSHFHLQIVCHLCGAPDIVALVLLWSEEEGACPAAPTIVATSVPSLGSPAPFLVAQMPLGRLSSATSLRSMPVSWPPHVVSVQRGAMLMAAIPVFLILARALDQRGGGR